MRACTKKRIPPVLCGGLIVLAHASPGESFGSRTTSVHASAAPWRGSRKVQKIRIGEIGPLRYNRTLEREGVSGIGSFEETHHDRHDGWRS